ncbi:metal-dependent hydrolase [soil metagenome]
MNLSVAAARRPIPARTVRTRRIAFEYPPDELPRHFAGGDLVMSHVVSVLSSMFPEGEDFFVRSVRHYRDEIVDPELKKQVAGFIGQEAMHGREHRAFNERLQALGFPTRKIDRLVKWGFQLDEKVLPPHVQLAITAALEHYTATLAYVLLSDPEARAMIDTDEVRSLLLWHALEESEHKSVAFDVFEEVSGSHRVRANVMRVVTVLFLGSVVLGTTASMLVDPATRDLRRLRRSVAALRRSPWLTRSVRQHIGDYNRRGFHPDDHDTSEVVARWRAELFGTDGTLAAKMK